jgi:hypothetical protein
VDLVLGLSMTSTDVRWVLVEGATAEGATICRGTADFDTLDEVLAAAGGSHLHAVGVTWVNAADTAASTLLDTLTDRGVANVITVSEQEATESLALGIADRGGYTDVAVCVVDSDNALFTLVSADGVTTERVDPSADDMLALLDRHDAQPEAIFVLGSADDLESIGASFHGAAVPVITAAEADLALARGAALASAWAVNTLDMRRPTRWRLPSRTGALISVVAAAAVVFVVSLSAAVGLGLTPDKDSTVAQRDTAVTTDQPVQAPIVPSVAQAAPQPVPAAPPPSSVAPPPEAPPVAQTIVEAAAPVPDAIQMVEPPAAPPPVYDAPPAAPPPPADVPPPAYVPPAPAPNYVPPAPQPRLRDRIIERIPIINRFH